MGRETTLQHDAPQIQVSLENRPAIFMVGSTNVGKRTLLSRLISADFVDASDFSPETSCYGWTIDTKYYTADLSIWMSHLDDRFSAAPLPNSKHLAALVMVFDISDPSSFAALKDWLPSIDIQKFEILLCIGNKADLLPGHFGHSEYRRYLEKRGESSSDPHPEFLDYGILETEGSSLLGDEEPSVEIRESCLAWCIQHNIEYIEACAANADFDKCLSLDGDLQGVERLYGALSAYMWPGMIMKSRDQVSITHPLKKEDFSDEESDFEIEYELLSSGSAEPLGDSGDGSWVDLDDLTPATDTDRDQNDRVGDSTSAETSTGPMVSVQEESASTGAKPCKSDEDMQLGLEDVEQLMCEIGNMRDNLRLMPDFQRKEMAAKLAMKMAAMFANSSDEDDPM